MRESVELKEIYTSDLKKEIIAFANANGGTVFRGIHTVITFHEEPISLE